MALSISAHAHVNGIDSAPPPSQDDDFFDQLLQLRDAVLESKHPRLRLPAAAVEQLKASLAAPHAPENVGLNAAQPGVATSMNGLPHSANLRQPSGASDPPSNPFPGLFSPSAHTNGSSHPSSTKQSASAGLDPIFLEKADSLVRAEGQLKRQRIERDLHDQVEKRRHASYRDKEAQAEALYSDVDAVLAQALALVSHVSGLKVPAQSVKDSSSFDENDYYSSQIESEWSSEKAPSNDSDRAAVAFAADYERFGDQAPMTSASGSMGQQRAKQPLVQPERTRGANKPIPAGRNVNESYTVEQDEDDEYIPQEPVAGFHGNGQNGSGHITPPEAGEDSDYEPGEISQESVVATPPYNAASAAQVSPQVPIIRNHLTHIAAPQPNRVSPLAVQKGPSIELELVNGRPEVVQQPYPQPGLAQSRPSSASPSGPGTGLNGRKRRNKKRKRDQEVNTRSKRRRERDTAREPLLYLQDDPRIKDEPISPPPFASLSDVSGAVPRHAEPVPAHVDLVSPIRASRPHYAYQPPAAAPYVMQYANAPPHPGSPVIVRLGSSVGHRPVQRDTQDLRRVASLQYAQRPASPVQRMYSPVGPYRVATGAYVEPQPQPTPADAYESRYRSQPEPSSVRYMRQRSASPVRLQEYRPVDRAESPTFVPSAAPRRVVVDQYGNRYYAAEPAPPSARASVAPVARRPDPNMVYDRAPSRMSVAYAQPQATQYDPSNARMALPPSPRQQYAQPYTTEYVDNRSYQVRDYQAQPVETVRYSEAPASPVYQRPPPQYEQAPPPPASASAKHTRYDPMPPPPAPEALRDPRYEQMAPPALPGQAREQTASMYAPSRAYSARPEFLQPAPITYAPTPRQGSVAPAQYVRQDAPPPPPARAVSVMPAAELGGHAQDPRTYGYMPQAAVRYVDDRGQEVQPRQVRQASQYMY